MISFETGVWQYNPRPFPLDNDMLDLIIIAQYWADFNMFVGGNVSYREILRTGGNEDIFEEVDGIIRHSFVNMRQYSSSWMFVATWDRMVFCTAFDSSVVSSHIIIEVIYIRM